MSEPDVTTLLARWTEGDREALDALMPLVYRELQLIATAYARREAAGGSMNSTAIVHEAYLRLVNQQRIQWQNRAHFYGVAAQMMRRILVDRARARHREKRGGGEETLVLDDNLFRAPARGVQLIALDDALTGLAKLDAQQSQVVEMRFFGGLSLEETAEAMRLSRATVHRYWVTARAWLIHELGAEASR